MKKITPLLVLLAFSSIWSQDFTLHIPGVEHEYLIPVDTTFCNIYFESRLGPMRLLFPDSSIEYLDFNFSNNISSPVEYRLTCFVSADLGGGSIIDTLQFEPTAFSSLDSLIVEPIDYEGEFFLGIRYVNLPGDTISGFTLNLLSDSTSYQGTDLRFSIAANAVSNWINFQPLSLGNIWKYEPFGWSSQHRIEIIDTSTVNDTSFFLVERQREFGADNLLVDTSIVYTLTDNQHQIFQGEGDASILSGQFPILGERYGIVIRGDGLIDYAKADVGYKYWQMGLGFYNGYLSGLGEELFYHLIGSNIDGVTNGDIGSLVGIEEAAYTIPTEFQIKVFPNPFNPATTISYDLPKQSAVSLIVFDIQGREVMTLQDRSKPPGNYEVQWNGLDQSGNPVSTGVYFCRLQAGNYSKTIKMVYLQ